MTFGIIYCSDVVLYLMIPWWVGSDFWTVLCIFERLLLNYISAKKTRQLSIFWKQWVETNLIGLKQTVKNKAIWYNSRCSDVNTRNWRSNFFGEIWQKVLIGGLWYIFKVSFENVNFKECLQFANSTSAICVKLLTSFF